MMTAAIKQIKIAFLLLLILTIVTGIIYPLVVTGVAQLLFPWRANGSLLKENDKLIGSALIGQSFNDPKYFWSRPSATTPFPYNAQSSSGSNLGPTNTDFLATMKTRVTSFRQANLQNQTSIPADLVTSSGSGLDPEISPEAAFYQLPRIAKARGVSAEDLATLINKLTQNRTFWILGEPRINVLELNLALDNLTVTKEAR